MSFTDAIKENKLTELARINNIRKTYTSESVNVSIDHVEGLGNFLEVEILCKEDTDTSEAQTRLQAFISDLHVRHIKVGYVELWLYKHNLEAYEAGRYHLS